MSARGRWRDFFPSGLGSLLQSDGRAQACKGLECPLTFAFLVSRPQAILPLLLIQCPLPEKIVEAHQDRMGHGHRGFLAPHACRQPVQRPSHTQRGLACRPGILHQHAPPLPMASAYSTLTALLPEASDVVHLPPFALSWVLPLSDYYDGSVTMGLASCRPSRSSLSQHVAA